MNRTLALVLGGGRGTRLYPLTKHRAKPAVPLAGKYRLIDIPLSNCINSGVNRIYVLTQFNSTSLHRHIRRTYAFDQFGEGFVEILAAQQTLEHSDWYQGTADAVRQNLRHLEQTEIDHVLILSGDQLYRMNFAEMMASHRRAEADVSIAGMPVDRETAKAMGIMRLDDTGRVAGFLEKPQTHKEMDMVRMDPAWIDAARHSQPRTRHAGQHGHLSLQPAGTDRSADQNRLPRFRPRNLSGGRPHAPRPRPSVRRLLGRHRHDPLVLRRQPGHGRPRRPVPPGQRHRADLTPGPGSCPPRASTTPRSAAA